MSFTLRNPQGQPMTIHSCLACGDTNRGDSVLCDDCSQCPRCGARFSLGEWKQDPILLRCLACLQGWKLEVRAVEGIIPERPEEELAFFAHNPGRLFDQTQEGSE